MRDGHANRITLWVRLLGTNTRTGHQRTAAISKQSAESNVAGKQVYSTASVFWITPVSNENQNFMNPTQVCDSGVCGGVMRIYASVLRK